jgi:hypothetical protein
MQLVFVMETQYFLWGRNWFSKYFNKNLTQLKEAKIILLPKPCEGHASSTSLLNSELTFSENHTHQTKFHISGNATIKKEK